MENDEFAEARNAPSSPRLFFCIGCLLDPFAPLGFRWVPSSASREWWRVCVPLIVASSRLSMLLLKGSRAEMLNLWGLEMHNAGKLHWPVRLHRTSTVDSVWLSEAKALLSTKHFERLVASGGQLWPKRCGDKGQRPVPQALTSRSKLVSKKSGFRLNISVGILPLHHVPGKAGPQVVSFMQSRVFLSTRPRFSYLNSQRNNNNNLPKFRLQLYITVSGFLEVGRQECQCPSKQSRTQSVSPQINPPDAVASCQNYHHPCQSRHPASAQSDLCEVLHVWHALHKWLQKDQGKFPFQAQNSQIFKSASFTSFKIPS